MATTDVPASPDMPVVVALSGEAAAGRKGLKSGAIGLVSNTVIGISSVAPAYSLASALGLVVVYVGVKAPGVMILAFVPMVLVAFAYQQLNKAMPDCGTTFTWATKAFVPRTGWMGGGPSSPPTSSSWPTSARSPGSTCSSWSTPTGWPPAPRGRRWPVSVGSWP